MLAEKRMVRPLVLETFPDYSDLILVKSIERKFPTFCRSSFTVHIRFLSFYHYYYHYYYYYYHHYHYYYYYYFYL